MPPSLHFREIDVDRDAETCIHFRVDSFVESFGSADDFYRAAGEGANDYLEGLKRKNDDWPGSCVHAWLDETIAGQIEMRRDRTDRLHAHVLLYYLRPELRGRGFGRQLDAYVRQACEVAGVRTATLRVSPTNGRAIAFYRRLGWEDRGADPDHPNVHIMERPVMHNADVHLSHEASVADRDAIIAGLVAYNEQHGFPWPWQDLDLILRDTEGTIVGGLLGETNAGWLFIKGLWVAESHRGHGHGTRLLAAAEDEARARHCLGVYLDTYSFQARPFYERAGYAVFGELPDHPPGGAKYYLAKRL